MKQYKVFYKDGTSEIMLAHFPLTEDVEEVYERELSEWKPANIYNIHVTGPDFPSERHVELDLENALGKASNLILNNKNKATSCYIYRDNIKILDYRSHGVG